MAPMAPSCNSHARSSKCGLISSNRDDNTPTSTTDTGSRQRHITILERNPANLRSHTKSR